MNQTTHSLIKFNTDIAEIGHLSFRRFNPENDAHILYSWVKMPYAKYWGMNEASFKEVKNEYTSLCALPHYEVYIGSVNDIPICIMEKYLIAKDRLAEYYTFEEDDYGMHILIAPPVKPIPNFTWHIFSAVLTFLFEDRNVGRVVVEPDMHNTKIHKLNAKAGFIIQDKIQLPEKKALLSFCTRSNFYAAQYLLRYKTTEPTWLEENIWNRVNKRLVAKAISEFSHELIIAPKLVSKNEGSYTLIIDDKEIEYIFKATKYALDHWDIDINSLIKKKDGKLVSIEAVDFINEFKNQLHITEDLIGVYLEEINSTLSSLAYKQKNENFTAKQLAVASFQEIEHAMIEGHPCFVANSGRIGFSKDEFLKFSPEANEFFNLIWLAGHKTNATFTAMKTIDYKNFIKNELGDDFFNFNAYLESKGLNADDYVYIPVHPWQWNNKISHIYINDIAKNDLVYLGKGKDQFSAQQSIRTLYNVSHTHKNYTKVALSILNMGFTRGLSPYYMKSTPHITSWIDNLLNQDEYLERLGFKMLGEIATIGYENSRYTSLGKTSAYNKMLSALWRENPAIHLKERQTCFTMASLLHLDTNDKAFIKYIIKASGLTTSNWIKDYLNAYLKPILHCFYAYELVFMPHGENILLVLDEYKTVGILMKDITEEVIVFNQNLCFNEHTKRLFVEAEDHMKVLTIFTDVFDSFFRFLIPILDKALSFKEDHFWRLVAECIKAYQLDHPQFQDKFVKYDLFKPAFERCCLNRLQLRKTTQMLNLADPVQSLIIEGKIVNPLARFI